jgi:hypothetical protein
MICVKTVVGKCEKNPSIAANFFISERYRARDSDISSLGTTLFIRSRSMNFLEKADPEMSWEKAKEIDQQVLGSFLKSYMKRYDQWKMEDLLVVALETLPKQVNKEKILDNLLKLMSEYEKRLIES